MSNGTVTGTNGPSNVEGIESAKKIAGERKQKSRSSKNVIVSTEWWWRSFSLWWAGFGFLYFFNVVVGVFLETCARLNSHYR